MDLWLWDPPDYQDYSTSQHDNEDHSMCDFPFGYGRDVIEEEALNERSCLQVLKILVDKAEEEIKELNEDIKMLHCQLAWYGEALIEKTDHLNILIKNLENGNPEDEHSADLQLVSPKPLLEHSVKREQGDRGITEISIQPIGGFNKEKSEVITSKDKKNVEEKECCTTMLKTNKRKSQSMELHVRNLNDLKRVDSMKEGFKSTRKVRTARAYKNVPSVSVKRETSKEPETGNRHSFSFKEGEEEHANEREMEELEHQRQEIQTLRTNREREMKKLKHQIQEIQTLRINPAMSSKREGQKMGSSSSSTQIVNVQQAYIASTPTSLPEKVTESSLNSQIIRERTNPVKSIEREGQKVGSSPIQNVNVQHSYITSTSNSLPEKVTESSLSSQIIRERTNPVKSIERQGQKMGSSSSSTQNVKVQQAYILSTSTSLPEKVTESSLSSQITGEKDSCRKFPIKLEIKDHGTSSLNRATEESRDDVWPCTDDLHKQTLRNLQGIGKSLKMKGYSKHTKAELIKLLKQKARLALIHAPLIPLRISIVHTCLHIFWQPKVIF